MEISGVSTSLNTQQAPSAPARGELQPADEQRGDASREQVRGVRGRRGLALGILHKELALRIWSRARHAAGYAEAPANTEDVAEEALGAARQVVAESPSTARQAVSTFRSKLEQATGYVRDAIGSGDHDADEIDAVVAKVEEGLDELETEVEGYRESSASVLAIDTRTKQRSTIQIRTQEGDVVRLSLKRVETMSATDVAYSDETMSVSSTEVAVSSRSRMVMSVEGDLNEGELEAIRNVFAQAEIIANEFFGGDIGAAFNVAQGFEFDTEQLARVNMRFRMREISSIAYAEAVQTLPAPKARPAAAPSAAAPAVAVPELAADVQPVEVQPAEPAAAQAVAAEAGESLTALDTSVFESFFETLNAFLRSVGEGFSAEMSASSLRYHYSESFKIEMLGAVLHALAPVDEIHAGHDMATQTDSVAAGQERGELL